MRKPGSTVRIPVNTFDSNDPSASVTATDWANTDCHIHKDGSTTQRASSSGETLSINYDTITGNHMLEIDTSDNTTAGFYAAGSHYDVRIEGVTVDGATINAWIGSFDLGYEDAILNTTIATLASQTSFTLTAGPADDDALNGCTVLVHDVASAVQVAIGYISDYTGSTKTVTLAADPGIFTMAATDNISIFMPSNVSAVQGTSQTAGDLAALITTLDTVADAIKAVTDNLPDSGALSDLAAILDDTDLIDDGTSGLAKIAADVAAVLVDTAEIGAAGAGLTEAGGDGDHLTEAGGDGDHLTEAGGNGDHLTESGGTGDQLTALATQASLDGLNDLSAAEANAEVDTALNTAIPASPTSGSINEVLLRLARSVGVIQEFTIDNTSFTATTTAAQVDAVDIGSLEATDDHYIGKIIIFTSGPNIYQATDITDYDGTNKRFTYTAVTDTPNDDDTFIVL